MVPPAFVAFMAFVAAEILFPVSVAFTLLLTVVDDNETPVVALLNGRALHSENSRFCPKGTR